VDGNDTDRPFTIRELGPNQSVFDRSYAHAAPKHEEVKEGVPARSDRIDEDDAFYIFRGDGENSVGATEEGNVLTKDYAHINEYREVYPAIPVRDIRHEIPFLNDRDGVLASRRTASTRSIAKISRPSRSRPE
jgi:hypothetical protein